MTELKIHEDILFYAFRYALGRSTGAVDRVIGSLEVHWDKLESHTQKQIKNEIMEHQERFKIDGLYGKDWQKVLALETKIKD